MQQMHLFILLPYFSYSNFKSFALHLRYFKLLQVNSPTHFCCCFASFNNGFWYHSVYVTHFSSISIMFYRLLVLLSHQQFVFFIVFVLFFIICLYAANPDLVTVSSRSLKSWLIPQIQKEMKYNWNVPSLCWWFMVVSHSHIWILCLALLSAAALL